ncbi:MAG: hypothetical protein Q8909_18665 [Bacteroidota bacterium]|nr:hypothetical protein [Bacteroidota bacterium]
MAQNLISAVLSDSDAAAVQQSITDARAKLSFLLSLQSDDVVSLIKVGNTFLPFIDKAYQTVKDHPEILSGVFNKEEFFKDYELVGKIRPVLNQINQLAEGLQKTYYAVVSDAMVASLEVYAAVKQNKDKVSGLNVVADEMAVFFKKSKAKSESTAK